MNHTPTPWTIEYSEPYDDEDEKRVYGINGADGTRIVTTDCGYYGPKEDDAKYIIHSANVHDALVKALRACLTHFDEKWPNMNFGIPEQCRKALAQAEKGAS